MAPSKRAGAAKAQAAGEPSAKRAKADPVAERVACVVAALGDDALMPPTVSKVSLHMLSAGAPMALATRVAERHEMQARVAALIQDVLSEAAAHLAARTAGADGAVAAAAAAVEEGASKLRAASEEAEAAQSVVDERRRALKAGESDLKAAEEEARTVAAKQTELRREKEAYVKDKAKYQAVEDDCLNVLVSGSWSSDKEAKKLSDKLIKDMEKYGTEPSLLASVPAVLLKKPEERKGFDEMVITSLRGIVQSRVQAMDAVIEANENSEKELAEEAAKHTATVEAAFAARTQAAEALTQAECARTACGEARRRAQQEVEEQRGAQAARGAEVEAARAEQRRLEVVAAALEALAQGPPAEEPASTEEAEQGKGGAEEPAQPEKAVDSPMAVDRAAAAVEVGGA